MPEEEVIVPAEEVVTPEAEPEAPEAEPEEESVEELKARLAKADEVANNYKIRAEKAEKKAKETPQPAQNGLSTKDVVYLAKADIHDDDVDEVLDYAKLKGISVGKAHEFLKPILAVRTEQRTTASAANTSSVRRGASKATGETLLENAKAGKLPDSDDDIARLVAAQAEKARKG